MKTKESSSGIVRMEIIVGVLLHNIPRGLLDKCHHGIYTNWKENLGKMGGVFGSVDIIL